MKKLSQELLRRFAKEQKVTSTAEVMESLKTMVADFEPVIIPKHK